MLFFIGVPLVFLTFGFASIAKFNRGKILPSIGVGFGCAFVAFVLIFLFAVIFNNFDNTHEYNEYYPNTKIIEFQSQGTTHYSFVDKNGYSVDVSGYWTDIIPTTGQTMYSIYCPKTPDWILPVDQNEDCTYKFYINDKEDLDVR